MRDSSVVMDGSAFHAAGDDDDLARDVARERVGGEDDDLRGDVLGLRDLAQSHRARDGVTRLGIDEAACHRRLGPARRNGIHASARRDPHDLVLQREKEATEDRRLRCRVVGVPCLAEDAGGRADEDERPVAVPLDLAQEARARRGSVAVRFARSVSSQRSSGSSQTGTSSRGQTPATATQTSMRPSAARASSNRRSTSASSVRSAWAIGLPPSSSARRAGALLAAVVVDEHARALGCERACTGRADAARGARDEHALAVEPRVDAA